MFPCYDKNNALGVNVICCHPCHVDIGNGFCRADLKKREGNKGILNMNGERFVVSLDSLVENLQPNP